MEDNLKKIEDNLNFIFLKYQRPRKKGKPKKKEDEPINQNQPNWL